MATVITPELQALTFMQLSDSASTALFEDVDMGIRFPLAVMLNKAEVDGRPNNNATAADGRYVHQLQKETGGNSVLDTDDINSQLLGEARWLVAGIDTTPNGVYVSGDLWRNWDWTHLPVDSRPITVNGFTVAGHNIDGSSQALSAMWILRYQIVRLTAEEFASLRASLP